jgi:hypothetical protein
MDQIDFQPPVLRETLSGLVATRHPYHPIGITKRQLINDVHGMLDLEAAKC